MTETTDGEAGGFEACSITVTDTVAFVAESVTVLKTVVVGVGGP